MSHIRYLALFVSAQCALILLWKLLQQSEKEREIKPGWDCLDIATLLSRVVTEEELDNCDQTDPSFWAYIRLRHLTPPSNLPYSFEKQPPSETMQNVWPLLQRMARPDERKPFFVEAGANDGIDASNTVWLEESQGWDGLLIECHPEVLPKLRRKNRRAYIADVCLSVNRVPSTEVLTSVDGWQQSSSLGKGDIFPDFAKTFTSIPVRTIPLYAILAALDVKVIDFFSLDIQSLEFKVLKHFPFNRILVKVWVMEVILLTEEDKKDLHTLMISNGYVESKMLHNGWSDLVYVLKSRL